MQTFKNSALIALAGSLVGSSVAFASLTPIYDTGVDPATLGTEIARLELNKDTHDWLFSGSANTQSGHEVNVGPVEVDATELDSVVYRVSNQVTFNQGGDSITLDAGDLIFEYRIRLVDAGVNTITTVEEFEIVGSPILGLDELDASAIKGRGAWRPDTNVPLPDPNPGDLLPLGPGNGAFLDFVWGTSDVNQPSNSEEISLLLFTSPRQIGDGWASFFSSPSQPLPNTIDDDTDRNPILIPIVPSPATSLAFVMALGSVSARRRRA
ncbi:MAG: hypothetical protein AAGD00_09295 [Planctomycetota bacterium]